MSYTVDPLFYSNF